MTETFEGYFYVITGSNPIVHLVLPRLSMYGMTRCGYSYKNRPHIIKSDFAQILLTDPKRRLCKKCSRYSRLTRGAIPEPTKTFKRKPRIDIHTVARRIGTDKAVNAGLAFSGSRVDTYIASWLNDGWELYSVQCLDSPIRVVKHEPNPKRWWEFWKPKHIEIDHGHVYDILWVLLRTR